MVDSTSNGLSAIGSSASSRDVSGGTRSTRYVRHTALGRIGGYDIVDLPRIDLDQHQPAAPRGVRGDWSATSSQVRAVFLIIIIMSSVILSQVWKGCSGRAVQGRQMLSSPPDMLSVQVKRNFFTGKVQFPIQS